MRPKILHQQAMELSFKAKQALEFGNQDLAFEFYTQAAELESKVAEFYFDKPELDPTRSILIRSAVYLNLKAGLVEEAQHFIFFGLLNIKDELIRDQLNDALELSIALKNIDVRSASDNYGYITLLRQNSVHYVLEPTTPMFYSAISLEMIKDFSESYLKSLKAYSSSLFKRISKNITNISNDIEAANQQFQNTVNPLVTQSGFGSFKFSVANDFVGRPGEIIELVKLKANIVKKYHDEIFTNPLTDKDIQLIKEEYDEEDINQIFRPLAKIKSNNSPFKVSYYDKESLRRVSLGRIINDQKKKLLTIKQISKDDIGVLESSITHTRSSQDGKITRNTILKEQLKSYEFDIKTKYIEPKAGSSILLNEEIIISVFFNSDKGFTFSFDDLKIEFTDIQYQSGLNAFYKLLFDRIIYLAGLEEKNIDESNDIMVIRKFIHNLESLIRSNK